MRISDRRYARDLRRYQLAWRMIRQGVRNRSVALWSELSIYRVKTLYAAYAEGSGIAQRGTAPYQLAQFWGSLRTRTEASILAGFLCAYGALPVPGEPSERLAGVVRGERLCRAYEEFTGVWPDAQLKLEHAMLLLDHLARREEMELTTCPQCDSLVVADRLALAVPRCAFCLHEMQSGRRYDRRAAPAVISHDQGWGLGAQGNLF